MIDLMVMYKVKRHKLPVVKKAITTFINAVKKHEKDTRWYAAYQQKDLVTFVHFISFKNKKAQQKHVNAPYTDLFVSILYPNCTEEPAFIDLNMIRGVKK